MTSFMLPEEWDNPEPKRPLEILGYRLECTCHSCPEQYDVYDKTDKQVAYLRLRHGGFRAECPDCFGEMVYWAEDMQGDGRFTDDERMRYLTAAIEAVKAWDEKTNGVMVDGVVVRPRLTSNRPENEQ